MAVLIIIQDVIKQLIELKVVLEVRKCGDTFALCVPF